MFRFLLFTWLVPLSVWASSITPEQRLEDFNQIVKWVVDDYGPLDFKQSELGFNLEAVTAKYREEIARGGSDDQFKYLLAKYVGEFRDAHFTLRYPSKAVAELGFTADLVQSLVVIDTIDRSVLPVEKFPFERGDVIQLWNQLPPLAIAKQISDYLNVSYEATGLRAGTFLLTKRSANRLPLPDGPVILSIQHRATGAMSTVTLDWNMSAVEPQIQTMVPIGLNNMCAEKSRIEPPPGARVITDVPFTAFSFESPKGRIGFIRIPHYYPTNEQGEEASQERFGEYQRVIEEFERTTNGLIIDQDFNCGGSVVYVNKLFSLFYRQPFEPAPLAFRASVDQVRGLRNQLAKFNKTHDGYFEFKEIVDEIERTLNAGGKMTRPMPMRGFMEVDLPMPGGNWIQPNPVGYSKPIVMLINEMSGSGGDLFPALMKDYGRAKLLGTRTMGAGGHLWNDPPLVLKNTKGSISLTRSMIYRPNGKPVENYGIEPDVGYDVTMDDFMNGYANYLNVAVEQL